MLIESMRKCKRKPARVAEDMQRREQRTVKALLGTRVDLAGGQEDEAVDPALPILVYPVYVSYPIDG